MPLMSDEERKRCVACDGWGYKDNCFNDPTDDRHCGFHGDGMRACKYPLTIPIISPSLSNEERKIQYTKLIMGGVGFLVIAVELLLLILK